MKKYTQKRTELFDGILPGLDEKTFTVNLEGEIYSFTTNDFENNSFEDLAGEIGQAEFNAIVQSEKYNVVTVLFKDYRSEEDLGLYYAIKDENLFVFSYGEFQSGRYMIYLESVWKMN